MSNHHFIERLMGEREAADDRQDADVHDILLEDEQEDDFEETVDDAVEDIRSEDVVINHFRV